MISTRFTIGVTNYDFDETEILSCEESLLSQTDLQKNQEGAPHLVTFGTPLNSWTLQIKEEYGTTRAKVESIITADDTITAYFDFLENQTSNPVTIILLPEQIIEDYTYGQQEQISHTLTFLQVP